MVSFMGAWLSACATEDPKGAALTYDGENISWKALNERVNKLSHGLLEAGIKKGDRVTFMFHNTPQFLEVNYAIQKIGAIPVPMNFRFSPKEVVYQANHSESVLFLFDSLYGDVVLKARPSIHQLKAYVSYGGSFKGVLGYEELLKGQPETEPPGMELKLDDPAVICYTGGTTGMPKGVVLSYGNHIHLLSMLLGSAPALLLEYGLFEEILSGRFNPKISPFLPMLLPELKALLSEVLNFSKLRDRLAERLMPLIASGVLRGILRNALPTSGVKVFLPSFPFFHDASYVGVFLHPIIGINTLVLHKNPSFDVAEVLGIIERERVQVLGNVPTAWRRIVDFQDVERFDLTSVKVIATGAGVCPAELKRKILGLFKGAVLVDGFGQTEMTPLTSVRIDTDPEKVKERSVGRSIVDARVVDEQGKELPRGEVGEIAYKSPTIMQGYFKDEKGTTGVIKDGWFYSGDLGCIDENGEIRVIERKNECISSGGEKVYPHEVEEVITAHPFVGDVCVIGVPDPEWGQAIKAIVRLKEGTSMNIQELRDWLKGKLAGYKIPKSVVFVDELPRSPLGKLLRRLIREAHEKAS
jgi:acyl-CoA synthetase (AMP-forming)/AMP-acid ligase II